MNHKWKDNICVSCGLNRKRKGWKIRMAITNHPPYDHYQRGVDWFYWKQGDTKGTFKRPDCSVELPNDERSVATDDASSNADG